VLYHLNRIVLKTSFRLFVAVFLVTLTIFQSCNVQENVAVPIEVNLLHKGLYIDRFQDILGDTAKENKLLRYVKSHDFNELSLYGLWEITNKPNKYPSLSKFISKARTDFGVTKISATHSTIKAFDECEAYNIGRNIESEKFDVFSIENEWWQTNPECNYACNQRLIRHIKDLKTQNNDNFDTEIYIGWLDALNNDYEEAKFLVNNLDKIAVHCYDSTPNFDYTKERLLLLAKAAKELNKKPEILIIFSAEQAFMFKYFSKSHLDNDFVSAYNDFVKDLKTSNSSILLDLNVTGYKIFTYSEAALAR
jgi:methionine synthase II (cobalamin-independent)